MELTAIIEALMVASDDPLPSAELARLIRARIAEMEDELLAQSEEEGDDYAEKSDASEVAAPNLSDDLKQLAEVTDLEVIEAIGQLNESYEESGRSFRALERAKGWKIYTSPDYGDFVKHLFPGRKPKRLSGPAMETLAVVAYRQPVTKAAIDAVRGVSSDGMLQKLLDLELVKIGGRADLPGRPLLYETTDYFFEHFGIKSPEELPNALELRTMELPEPEEEVEEEPAEEKQATLAEADSSANEEAPEVAEEEVEDFAQPEDVADEPEGNSNPTPATTE
ncbi:MAG: SMC-Scp complex subunit ScpB [Roseibacillus sp.]